MADPCGTSPTQERQRCCFHLGNRLWEKPNVLDATPVHSGGSSNCHHATEHPWKAECRDSWKGYNESSDVSSAIETMSRAARDAEESSIYALLLDPSWI